MMAIHVPSRDGVVSLRQPRAMRQLSTSAEKLAWVRKSITRTTTLSLDVRVPEISKRLISNTYPTLLHSQYPACSRTKVRHKEGITRQPRHHRCTTHTRLRQSTTSDAQFPLTRATREALVGAKQTTRSYVDVVQQISVAAWFEHT